MQNKVFVLTITLKINPVPIMHECGWGGGRKQKTQYKNFWFMFTHFMTMDMFLRIPENHREPQGFAEHSLNATAFTDCSGHFLQAVSALYTQSLN
jgi:hypothetical protein